MMDLNDLEELNAQFAKETKEFHADFMKLAEKYFKKDKRMAIINMIHLPLNLIMNIINLDKDNLTFNVFPELPDLFIRFMKPFLKLKVLWGQIPNQEWVKEYGRLYNSQFDEWFIDEEDKKRFNEWFEYQSKKNAQDT